MIEIRKQIRKDEGGHVAHDDLAELLLDVQRRTNVGRRLLDDVGEGDDVGGEVAVRRFVDHLDDGVDVLDAVLVGDDVERDRNRAVDQDPLQSLDVSEAKQKAINSFYFESIGKLKLRLYLSSLKRTFHLQVITT